MAESRQAVGEFLLSWIRFEHLLNTLPLDQGGAKSSERQDESAKRETELLARIKLATNLVHGKHSRQEQEDWERRVHNARMLRNKLLHEGAMPHAPDALNDDVHALILDLSAVLPRQVLELVLPSVTDLCELVFAWQPLEEYVRSLTNSSAVSVRVTMEERINALAAYVGMSIINRLHELRRNRNIVIHGGRIAQSTMDFVESTRHAMLSLQTAVAEHTAQLEEAQQVFLALSEFHGEFSTLLRWIKIKDMLGECMSGTFRDFSRPRLASWYEIPLDQQFAIMAPRVDDATREVFIQMQQMDRLYRAGSARMSIAEFSACRLRIRNALYLWLGWRTWISRSHDSQRGVLCY